MKTAVSILSVLFLSTIAACGHFPIMDRSFTTPVSQKEDFPSELNAYLDGATSAAKQIVLIDDVAEWQIEYDKVKELYAKLPEEAVNKAIRKECHSIIEQMEIGKLAVELKRVDVKTGAKQCREVSAEIMKHVKNIRTMNSKTTN